MHVIYREKNTRLVYIPTNWKLAETGIYEVHLILRNFENIQSKFIAVPYGDKIIINIFPCMEEKKTYSMIIQTLKYVNPCTNNPCFRYLNLREISHRYVYVYKEYIILSIMQYLFKKCNVFKIC